jgi:hypothetical protein
VWFHHHFLIGFRFSIARWRSTSIQTVCDDTAGHKLRAQA